MGTKISEIYNNYRVPLDLQSHMLRASAIAIVLCENWKGPPINQSDITTTMLIHDIGNIAKMDFNSGQFPPSSEREINTWRNIKRKFINKYGADDHIATFNIATELGLNPRILWLVTNKIFIHNEMIAKSDDYELKICAYADQRTGPSGIVSLNNRFDELKSRYGSKANASINHPRIRYLIKSAFIIEKQLLEFVSIEELEIANQKISHIMDDLRKYEIQTGG